MRCPSEYFFRRLLTFHSTSAGGFLEPPPKYMSYSIFSRRSWSSNTVSSSSTAKDWLHFSCQIQYQTAQPTQPEQSGEIYHRPGTAPTCSRYKEGVRPAVPWP